MPTPVSATVATTSSYSAPTREGHAPSFGRELDRVRQEIREDLMEPLAIAHDEVRAIEVRHELDLLRDRGGSELVRGGPEHGGQVQRRVLELHLARDDPRDVHDVVDELPLQPDAPLHRLERADSSVRCRAARASRA
jgi:hypothetical protein